MSIYGSPEHHPPVFLMNVNDLNKFGRGSPKEHLTHKIQVTDIPVDNELSRTPG